MRRELAEHNGLLLIMADGTGEVRIEDPERGECSIWLPQDEYERIEAAPVLMDEYRLDPADDVPLAVFGRVNSDGNIDLFRDSGERLTRLPNHGPGSKYHGVYPVGADLGAQYEHPRGLTVSPRQFDDLGFSLDTSHHPPPRR